MQQLVKYAPFLILAFLVFSCNSSNKKKKADQTEEKVVQKEQIYSVDTSGVSIKWTAYKFTDKLGVSGGFDQFSLNLKNPTGTVETLLKDAAIVIHTSSVNSGNEIRDPKLRTSFFKVFHTDTIKGQILDAQRNKGALELKMNNISNDVEYNYSLKNDTLFLSTHLDVMQWNGKEALNSLNKECYELHTGTDGISKLWPDVDVTIKLPLQKAPSSE
ncbi:YceI family protein [Maribacter sp. 2307ULW6-5]|uniref:YceI family protein n=1 Tax=Maribacter sp. 2307ULW6-5 TaxID=3386275 RepID=UPI0039BCACA5